MYVANIRNQNGKSTFLLRESYREDNKVKSRTVANISHLPQREIDLISRVLSGENLIGADQVVEPIESIPSGHVQAVLGTMKQLGIEDLLLTRRTRNRDLVMGMIVERILHPASKLGTVRLWKTSTLARELDVEDANVNELYDALDWLYGRQAKIEEKLAARHLSQGGLALYDTSNCLYEGSTCSLARIGHDKEGRHGALIISFGLLADGDGRPVAIGVYPGNTGDPATVPDQAFNLRIRFGLEDVVMVGDRGLLTNKKIEYLKSHPGLGWISALRSDSIRKLAKDKIIQPTLFDEMDLAEIESPDFPGERLIACFNPFLASDRRRKRSELLSATEVLLDKIVSEVDNRTDTPMKAGEIGKKVGRVLYRYKMGKHFETKIEDGVFSYSRNESSIERESQLDGIYVIRTSEPAHRLSAEDTVRGYKLLAEVEQDFRSMKGMDVRPIFHRDEKRVKAHFFLCMLAYYVKWHMKRSLAPLLFHDETLSQDKKTRDPVKRAEISKSAKDKKARKVTSDGHPVHSFQTLMEALASQATVTYRVGTGTETFVKTVAPTPLQKKAFDLLGL